MLQFGFPEISWDATRFSKSSKKSSQRWLFQQVAELFPGKQILYDYRIKKVEFDIWLPEERLALEYQGEHHFRDFARFIGGANVNVANQFVRDMNKHNYCSLESIKLVEVPYWWDGNKESLQLILEE
eukprot:TRINITY_DN9601_c0_g1_i1.p1 TRINITY_DN9601_c0_g1~~TRINITY_DN9601_c0_g1_i1.p1  ORF type:complete len:143 (-),score=22.01 TRINITY_DN9601_c0_g1_i1:139-519(-)